MTSAMEDEDYLVYLERLASDDMGRTEREMDFDYENFLHHVREDGKSYVFESVDPHTGLPISVKYESYADDPPTANNRRNNVGGRRNSCENKKRNLFMESEVGRLDLDGGRDGVVRGRTYAGGEGEALYDESYQYFMSRAIMRGDSVVLDLGDNRFVEYERRDAGANGGGDGRRGVREESSERSCEGSLSFHERLVAVLSKPYSRREYNELWQRVSCRAGERQGRNLRSREVKFMIGKPGKSYLDHYPDFAAKLKSARQTTQLELLRGFFFWMQNLCTEGAYQPWLRSSNQHATVQVVSEDCAMLPPVEGVGPEIVDVLDI